MTEGIAAPIYTPIEHAMTDIETLGKGNNAAILSIGMVKFDPFTEQIMDSFYVPVDPESCQSLGLKLDASTIMWWMKDERTPARSAMMQETSRLSLPEALYGLVDWFGDDKPVWGNGATFDNVILRSAFEACGIEVPWMFWNDRCYRTLKNMAPGVKLERIGTYHNALDDALSQAVHMQRVVKHLGLVDL